MKVDNVTCDDNSQLDLFPITDEDRVNCAVEAYCDNPASLSLVTTLIEIARLTPGSVVGVSTVDRICGSFNLLAGSIVIFIKSPGPVEISKGFSIPAGDRIMVYVELGENFYCPYSAKPVPPRPPSPATSPTVPDCSRQRDGWLAHADRAHC